MKQHGLLNWWINNPIAANLLMMAIIVAGIMSYCFGIEKEPFPAVTYPEVRINVNWQGANPKDIEDQIITRIEAALKNIEGIKRVMSFTGEGWGVIQVKGNYRINRQQFSSTIRDRVNAINGLPSDIDKPRITVRSNSRPMIRLALSGDIHETLLNKIALQLQREIVTLPLISVVSLSGERDEEIAIEISESTLQYYNLTFNEIADAIRKASITQSSGSIRNEGQTIQLSVRNRAEDQLAFENISIRTDSTGTTILLKDIANVIQGLKDSRNFSTFDGKPAILLNIMSSEYMDIPKMSHTIASFVEKKQAQLPEGVSLKTWSNWNDVYRSRLHMIFNNAVSGLILVFFLLLLFLHYKIASWVCMGIVTSFAGAFVLLPLFDVSLNMISLFAFLMVIGIVVDDAIVVGESIYQAKEDGYSGKEAALKGVSDVIKPVIFGILTTILVFLPMVFLPGSASAFNRTIAIVVIASLLFSLIESLWILPSHLQSLSVDKPEKAHAKHTNKHPSIRKRIENATQHFIEYFYQPFLIILIRQRYAVLCVFCGFLFLSYQLLNLNYITQSFKPEIQDDKIQITVTLPETTSYSRAFQVLEQINAGQNQLIDFAQQKITHADQGLIEHFYSQIRGSRIISIIQFVEEDKRVISMDEASQKLQAFIDDIPDAEDIEFQSTLNQKEPSIGYVVRSNNSEALQAAVHDLKTHISTYDDIYLVRDNIDKGSEAVVFKLKPGAESLGISLREINAQIRQAYLGQEVQRLPREGADSRIRIRYSKNERESFYALEQLNIRTRDGREIPLTTLVTIENTFGVNRIIRRDGVRVASIRAEYAGTKARAIKNAIRNDFLPQWRKKHPDAHIGYDDAGEEESEFKKKLIHFQTIAFIGAYMLMAIAFRSYIQPFLLLSAIPFAFVGAVLGHALYGTTYSMFSMLGILAAAGVVVNDNLVLVDKINRNYQRLENHYQAVIDACCSRFRPITLTSLTTFIGLLPMVSAQSVQAKFLVPMVVSLAYGVLFATFAALLLVPCLYLIGVDILQLWKKCKSIIGIQSATP